MKQTPFYELSVALKDRPRSFQRIVISSLIFCSIIFLESAVKLIRPEEEQSKEVAKKYTETKSQPVFATGNITLQGR